MASNYTENYGLCQWEATDQVLRTEFNEDNAKIDAALSQKTEQSAFEAAVATIPKIKIGSYGGDGTNLREIPVGFTPKAVFVSTTWGEVYDKSTNTYWGGLAVQGESCYTTNDYAYLVLVEGGFRLTQYVYNGHTMNVNKAGITYNYVAFG